jgi:hypothetical protein
MVESIPVPLADAKAFPVLKIHISYGCMYCSAVSKREDEIRKHYNVCHASVRRRRGGAVTNSKGLRQKRLNSEHYGDQPAYLPASYQRFFTAGVKGSTCFRVTAPEKPTQGATSPGQGSLPGSDKGQSVMDQILGTLARLETTQSHVKRIPDAALTKTQVSPWLEKTRWLHYLKGLPLDKAARLARLPTQHDEPMLYEIGLAVDRLVEAAHLSLCKEEVNFFGQKQITSFLLDREFYSRPPERSKASVILLGLSTHNNAVMAIPPHEPSLAAIDRPQESKVTCSSTSPPQRNTRDLLRLPRHLPIFWPPLV